MQPPHGSFLIPGSCMHQDKFSTCSDPRFIVTNYVVAYSQQLWHLLLGHTQTALEKQVILLQ